MKKIFALFMFLVACEDPHPPHGQIVSVVGYQIDTDIDVRVFHDEKNAVTCWVTVQRNRYEGAGITCLPDKR